MPPSQNGPEKRLAAFKGRLNGKRIPVYPFRRKGHTERRTEALEKSSKGGQANRYIALAPTASAAPAPGLGDHSLYRLPAGETLADAENH